ncbi:hypothetical protein SKAU_G00068160 [Synaphobranchus kaupii]|uniref:Uncharacterized protein n=1 Tax=Synaphobranchus kaupii TaxID=118154 RepID=A0A9Q1G753_SYNKA|nr:hypothetical protein SKAU_G00068160 [Synaphobranchus kaupii]
MSQLAGSTLPFQHQCSRMSQADQSRSHRNLHWRGQLGKSISRTETDASASGLQQALSESDQNGQKAGQDSVAGRGIVGRLGLPRYTPLDPQPEDMKGASLLPPAPAAPRS